VAVGLVVGAVGDRAAVAAAAEADKKWDQVHFSFSLSSKKNGPGPNFADAILSSTPMASDADAIQAVLHGDADRYAELVDKYQGQAIRLAFSFLGNYEDARDASQDAFVSAYRSLARFRGGAKFSTWLYRIIMNACKDARRRRSRQPVVVATIGEPDPDPDATGLFVEVDDPAAGPSEQLANRELALALSQAVQSLPEHQRTAFLLHHVHGVSLEEAAEVMRCRVGTVKSHVFRATAALRVRLSPWLAKEGF